MTIIPAAIEFIEWTASALGADADRLERALWISLVVGLVFATVHLVTMLVTRWGDHQASSKSLIFSILIHITCALGLLVFNPPIKAIETKEKPEELVQLRRLFVEGDENLLTHEPGNMPAWEKPPVPIHEQLSRLDRTFEEITPPVSPDRTEDPLTRPEMDVPDLQSLPDEPVVIPKPDDRGVQGLRAEAAIPLKIDDPTAESRPEVRIPTASRVVQRQIRSGRIDTAITRQAETGAIDRIERRLTPIRQLSSIDVPSNPSSFLKRGVEASVIRRRTGPSPSVLPAEAVGTTVKNPTKGATGGAPTVARIGRTPTRTRQSLKTGSVERFRPERSPRTPRPQTGFPVNVRDSVAVTIPRSGLKPSAIRPNFETLRNGPNANIPATYRLRSLAKRKETARKYGGTDASERAVESSLRWLADHQTREGYWDADNFGSGQVKIDENGVDRRYAGKYADPGVTALAILAFLGAGYTHEEGQYAENVERALFWLIRQQRDDGFLGGEATHYAQMYCHGMATYAMAEAHGMQNDPTIDTRLRTPIRRAVGYTLKNQNPKDGGWRYLKGQKSDMSMFGWQLMALKSAEIAGIAIPGEAKSKMVQFLKDRSLGERNGLAAYREGTPVSPAMTAEALFCKQMFKIKRSNSASIEATEYLKQHLPKRSETNLYYWYYGTLAMYQYGGTPWREWNERIRDVLVDSQKTTGEMTGSWNPDGPWGRYGGRVYSTALSTLCLEVYYRFLPLYQMGGRYDDE